MKRPRLERADVVELSPTLRAVIHRRGAIDLLRHDKLFHLTDHEAAKLKLAYAPTAGEDE